LKLLDGNLPAADGEYELAELIARDGLAEQSVRAHWVHYKRRYCGSMEDLFQEAKLALILWVRQERIDPKTVAVTPKLTAFLKRAVRLAVKKLPIESGLQAVVDEDGTKRSAMDFLPDDQPNLLEERQRLEKLDEAARTFWNRWRGRTMEFSGTPGEVLRLLRKGQTVWEIADRFHWPLSEAREEVRKVTERVKAAFEPHGDELAHYYLYQTEPQCPPSTADAQPTTSTASVTK